MIQLGNGLSGAERHEDALSVQEPHLSMIQRLGDSELNILAAKGNLGNTYKELGQVEKALSMARDVYSGYLKLDGEENRRTLIAANTYAAMLKDLQRFKEAKRLLRKEMPIARRVLGEGDSITLKTRWLYAMVLYQDPAATIDDLRESLTEHEEMERIARRVFGGAHPLTSVIEASLRNSRTVIRAREDGKEVKFVY